MTLYELCTLQPAFGDFDRARLLRRIAHEDPPAPRKINPSIPRDLETLILKAIDKQPAQRYQSARMLAEDIRLFLADRPVQARRTTTTERAWRWCRRNPSLASLGVCVALLAAVVFSGAIWFAFASQQQSQQLREQTAIAQRHETLARKSETEALASLFQVSRSRAAAARTSGRRGQRAEGLAAIAQAAALLPRFHASESDQAAARLQLRNDAIACLARVDLQTAKTWKVEEPWTTEVDIDAECEQYAQADHDGNIVVRRVSDDRELMRFPSPGWRAWKLRFSPDSRFLAATYHPVRERVRLVCVWEVATGRQIVREDGPMRFGDSAFSPDGRHFAIGMSDRKVRFYDLADGSLAGPPLETELEPHILVYSPYNRRLVMADAQSPRFEVVNLDDHSRQVISVTSFLRSFGWSPDEAILVAGSVDGDILLWNDADLSAAPERIRGHRNAVVQVIFNHRGDRLVSRSWDDTVRLWDFASRRELLRTHGSLALGSQFSSDDRLLKFATRREQFGIWRITDTGPLRVLTSEVEIRHGIEFCSANPRLILTATQTGVELWDAYSAKRVDNYAIGETVRATMTPDGSSLLSAGAAGVRRWPIRWDPNDPNRWIIGASETIDETATARLAIAADGRSLVVSQQKKAWGYDLHEPESRKPFGPQPDLHDVVISPDGRWVVTTSWAFGKGIRVWDRSTGECVQDLDRDNEVETAGTAAFSPDGTLLATVTMASRAVWRVGSWDRLHSWNHETDEGWPSSAAFSHDNRLLALPHSRLAVQLVDARTGKQLAILESPEPAGVGQLAFNNDATLLAVLVDNQIQLWDLRELRRELARIGLDYPADPADRDPTDR